MFQPSELRPPYFLTKRCPHCRTVVMNPTVISTGCCPGCGRRVLAWPETAIEPTIDLPMLELTHSRIERITRRFSRHALMALMWFFVFVVGIIVFRDSIRGAIGQWVENDRISDLAVVLAYGPFLVMSIYWCARIVRLNHQSQHCPACRSTLTTHVALLRLTGRCPSCGTFIVANLDLPERDSSKALIPIEMFRAAWQERMKRLNRPLNRATIWLGVVVASSIVLAASLPDFPKWAEKRWGPYGAVAPVMLMSLAVLTAFLPFTVAIVRHSRSRSDGPTADPSMRCPHCETFLEAPGRCIASKRCDTCRRIVFAEPGTV